LFLFPYLEIFLKEQNSTGLERWVLINLTTGCPCTLNAVFKKPTFGDQKFLGMVCTLMAFHSSQNYTHRSVKLFFLFRSFGLVQINFLGNFIYIFRSSVTYKTISLQCFLRADRPRAIA